MAGRSIQQEVRIESLPAFRCRNTSILGKLRGSVFNSLSIQGWGPAISKLSPIWRASSCSTISGCIQLSETSAQRKGICACGLQRMQGMQLLDRRHDPMHELVEERYSEGGFTVDRAEDHTLANEGVADRGDGLNLDAKAGGNFAGTVRRGTHPGQGSQVVLLLGSQAVEAHTEETLVQAADGQLCGPMNVGNLHGGTGGDVPGFLAPLLKEIGVALGDFDDLGEGFRGELRALIADRNLQGLSRIGRLQGTDLRVFEEAFGIRF